MSTPSGQHCDECGKDIPLEYFKMTGISPEEEDPICQECDEAIGIAYGDF